MPSIRDCGFFTYRFAVRWRDVGVSRNIHARACIQSQSYAHNFERTRACNTKPQAIHTQSFVVFFLYFLFVVVVCCVKMKKKAVRPGSESIVNCFGLYFMQIVNFCRIFIKQFFFLSVVSCPGCNWRCLYSATFSSPLSVRSWVREVFVMIRSCLDLVLLISVLLLLALKSSWSY